MKPLCCLAAKAELCHLHFCVCVTKNESWPRLVHTLPTIYVLKDSWFQWRMAFCRFAADTKLLCHSNEKQKLHVHVACQFELGCCAMNISLTCGMAVAILVTVASYCCHSYCCHVFPKLLLAILGAFFASNIVLTCI